MENEEKVKFESGATGSKCPRYDLIPQAAIDALARRFELGEEKYKGHPWNAYTNPQYLDDVEWIKARACHAIKHAMKELAIITWQIEDDGDDNAGAIMWAGACLAAYRERRKNVGPLVFLPSLDSQGKKDKPATNVCICGHSFSMHLYARECGECCCTISWK